MNEWVVLSFHSQFHCRYTFYLYWLDAGSVDAIFDFVHILRWCVIVIYHCQLSTLSHFKQETFYAPNGNMNILLLLLWIYCEKLLSKMQAKQTAQSIKKYCFRVLQILWAKTIVIGKRYTPVPILANFPHVHQNPNWKCQFGCPKEPPTKAASCEPILG